MTLDEAIENLRWLLPAPENYEKALTLGIEALERLKELRVKTPTPIYLIEKPLPSETEEVK